MHFKHFSQHPHSNSKGEVLLSSPNSAIVVSISIPGEIYVLHFDAGLDFRLNFVYGHSETDPDMA